VFCETAKLLWQSAYLFRENLGGIEKQQNYKQIQGLIENGIRSAIRSMIPVKSLLKDCIHSDMAAPDDDSSDSEDEAAKAPVAEIEAAKVPVAEIEAAKVPVAEIEAEHPVVKALLDGIAEAPAPAPAQTPLIVVDDEPQVSFNDFEQIFDGENHDATIIQPTQFHEGKGYDEEDEEPGLTILDDVGTPLSAEDLDAPSADNTLGPIEFDELIGTGPAAMN
jgi:hypothetical protein